MPGPERKDCRQPVRLRQVAATEQKIPDRSAQDTDQKRVHQRPGQITGVPESVEDDKRGRPQQHHGENSGAGQHQSPGNTGQKVTEYSADTGITNEYIR